MSDDPVDIPDLPSSRASGKAKGLPSASVVRAHVEALAATVIGPITVGDTKRSVSGALSVATDGD